MVAWEGAKEAGMAAVGTVAVRVAVRAVGTAEEARVAARAEGTAEGAMVAAKEAGTAEAAREVAEGSEAARRVARTGVTAEAVGMVGAEGMEARREGATEVVVVKEEREGSTAVVERTAARRVAVVTEEAPRRSACKWTPFRYRRFEYAQSPPSGALLGWTTRSRRTGRAIHGGSGHRRTRGRAWCRTARRQSEPRGAACS